MLDRAAFPGRITKNGGGNDEQKNVRRRDLRVEGRERQRQRVFPCAPDIAQRAQGLFNMDYTTVDMAETGDGPIVFEVSAFGGFRGAREGLGINIAERYVDYVLEQIGSS